MKSSSRNTVYRCALVLALVLAGGAMAQDEEPGAAGAAEVPTRWQDMKGLDGTPMFPKEEVGNRCMINEFTAPGGGLHLAGSGLHLAGSTGGLLPMPLVMHGATPPAQTIVLASTPRTVTRPVPSNALGVALSDLGKAMNEDVTLLVADEFGGVFSLPVGLFGLGEESVAKVDQMRSRHELPHGALVMNHLHALIQGTGLFDQPQELGTQSEQTLAEAATYTWTNKATHATLTVAPVDLGDMTEEPITTGDIANAIDQAIQGTEGRVVVNMSWNVLPCATVDEFRSNITAYDTFEKYVLALAEAAVGQGDDALALVDDLIWLLSTAGGQPDSPDTINDPLFGLLRRVAGKEEGVLVASAGNFRLDFPLLPAALSSVIGVGASSDGLPPPVFANRGDVRATAAWYMLTGALGEARVYGEGEVGYAGTSYAAPVVSLYAALALGNSTDDHCLVGTRPLLWTQRLQDGAWRNASVLDAQARCTP